MLILALALSITHVAKPPVVDMEIVAACGDTSRKTQKIRRKPLVLSYLEGKHP